MKRGNEFEEFMGKTIYKHAKIKEDETMQQLRKENEVLTKGFRNITRDLLDNYEIDILTCNNPNCDEYLIINRNVNDVHAAYDTLWLWTTCDNICYENCPVFCVKCKDMAKEYYYEPNETICKVCKE